MSRPVVSLSNGKLSLSGDVTPENVVGIRGEGERLIAETSGPAMVADLSDLGAAHSVILSLLMCWVRHAESEGISLRFEGVGERLRSLAALSGLDEHLSGFAVPLPAA